jgi:DNA-directed RNA polymerase specialized sigma24 family protein
MTPEMRRDFEKQWPMLSRRVEMFLIRKGIPASRRDDILQETALRLIKVWNQIDPFRSVPALATTIALNLVRDEARRRNGAANVAELPDLPEPFDVETAGLARVELARVRIAMTQLSPAQRAALLREVGSGVLQAAPGTDAEKMLRMRARKKLALAMQRVSGVLALRLRRIQDLWQVATSGVRDALFQGVSCLGCVAIGLIAGLDGNITAPAKAAPQAATNLLMPGAHVGTTDVSSKTLRSLKRTTAPSTKVKNQASPPADSGKAAPKEATGAPKAKGTNPPDEGPGLPVDVPDARVDPPDVPINPEPPVPVPAPPNLELPVPAPLPGDLPVPDLGLPLED